MSIRVRLELWYGVVFSVASLLVMEFGYAFHARGHYDDLDRALIATASHTADEVATSTEGHRLLEGSGGFRVILRVYSADGAQQESSASADRHRSAHNAPDAIWAGVRSPGRPDAAD